MAKRLPGTRLRGIKSFIEERGEVSRVELREWALERKLVTDDVLGRTNIRTVLIRLRRAGIVDYSPEKVWLGRNPEKAANLSSEFAEARKKFSDESRRIIQQLIEGLSDKAREIVSGPCCHGGVAS